MKEICKQKECTGCKACFNICPKNAISFEINEKGFYYPLINQEKCINCGMCKSVCPNLKSINKNDYSQKFFACKNKDNNTRKTSSSGGVASEISKYIIKNNGIVYGAVYDKKNNFIVKNKRCINLEEMYETKTSKYVQSDINTTYSQVEKDLKNSLIVLFTGTPCQIVGLKNYLKKDYKNLITIDNICHGVPSVKIYQEYIEYMQCKFSSKVKNINFRYKTSSRTQNMEIIFENAQRYFSTNADDIFYKLFQGDYILRDSCYQCKYSSYERVSDITLGDFWDFKNSLKDFEDKKGISLVIINSKKGEELFNSIKKNMYFIEKNKDECYQPNLEKPTKKSADYELFWKDYKEKGFLYVTKKYPKLPLKIKIKKIIKKIMIITHIYKE